MSKQDVQINRLIESMDRLRYALQDIGLTVEGEITIDEWIKKLTRPADTYIECTGPNPDRPLSVTNARVSVNNFVCPRYYSLDDFRGDDDIFVEDGCYSQPLNHLLFQGACPYK